MVLSPRERMEAVINARVDGGNVQRYKTGSGGEAPGRGGLPAAILGRERLTLWHHLRAARALIVCEAVLLGSLLLFDRPLIRGDAVAYFMWTASFGKDFDMDLQNQAERFGPLNTYMALPNPRTGHYASVFAWGQGVLLLPAFWAARALDQLPFMRVNDDWFLAQQAYPFAYSLTAMVEVNLLTLVTAALAYGMARRFDASPVAAAVAGLATVWGTPLYYYTTIQPLYSHASATFTHTLALFLFFRALCSASAQTSRWSWLLTGLAFGLAALTRWQLAASFAVAACVLIFRREWAGLGWMALGFGGIAWHIPYTFSWMFGSPLAVPMEASEAQSGFLSLPRYFVPVLFSDQRGLFVWSPIIGLGLAGVFRLFRRRRVVALTLGGVFVAQALVNSGVRDWWAGESFGMRRLTEVYPVAAVGVAALLTVAGDLWQSGETKARVLGGALYAGVGTTALYGLALIVAHLVFGYFTHPSFGFVTQPMFDTASNVLRFFFFAPPKFHLIWPMMEHHFGPWAWTWPGP